MGNFPTGSMGCYSARHGSISLRTVFLLNLALFSCDCMQEGDGSRDCDLHVDNILFAPGLMCVYAIACMCLCVCVCVCMYRREKAGWKQGLCLVC